jgi:hypothetical protein
VIRDWCGVSSERVRDAMGVIRDLGSAKTSPAHRNAALWAREAQTARIVIPDWCGVIRDWGTVMRDS